MANDKKILICDDEEGIRESLKLILGEKYELLMSHNGQECLSKLEKDKDIKVVLMDIKMPKQNGLEVTRDIKQRFPGVKVIIVTGYASAEIAKEALASGADDYIPKPFNSKEIINKINKIV